MVQAMVAPSGERREDGISMALCVRRTYSVRVLAGWSTRTRVLTQWPTHVALSVVKLYWSAGLVSRIPAKST